MHESSNMHPAPSNADQENPSLSGDERELERSHTILQEMIAATRSDGGNFDDVLAVYNEHAEAAQLRFPAKHIG